MRQVRADRRLPAPGRLVDAGGLAWHVEEAGSGPDLVLLHGYLGSTATWKPAWDLLATRFHVMAADLPGAGYSARPADAPYDPPWLAEQLDVFLKAVGASKPVVGGHSLGAAVATWWVHAHPQSASGLLLVSPLAYRQEPPPGLRIAKRFPGVMGAFFSSFVGRAVIPLLVRRAAFAGQEMRATVHARRLLEHLDAPGGWTAATRMGLAANERAPDAAQLGSVAVPTLVVWGESDVVHHPRFGPRILADLRCRKRLAVLQDAGHNCHEERPEEFAREVCAWFGQV